MAAAHAGRRWPYLRTACRPIPSRHPRPPTALRREHAPTRRLDNSTAPMGPRQRTAQPPPHQLLQSWTVLLSRWSASVEARVGGLARYFGCGLTPSESIRPAWFGTLGPFLPGTGNPSQVDRLRDVENSEGRNHHVHYNQNDDSPSQVAASLRFTPEQLHFRTRPGVWCFRIINDADLFTVV